MDVDKMITVNLVLDKDIDMKILKLNSNSKKKLKK